MSVTLHHGDCLGFMKDIPSRSVDLILCDLPYGTTQNKWDSIIPLDSLWSAYLRIAKENAAIVLTATQPFTSKLVMSQPNIFKYEWIWEKHHGTGHLNAKKQPLRKHEQILVFYGNQPTYNPQKTTGHSRVKVSKKSGENCKGSSNYGEQVRTDYDSTERYPTTLLRIPSDKQRSSLHPTQKPVALMEYLIKTYTNEGDTVLDNCMGSGTTGTACKNLNRKFIGIEKDENYFNIAKTRIEGVMGATL